MLFRLRDRLRWGFWHALDRYDELKWRLRENQAGRSALGFLALLLLAGGAALGFIAANATAHEDVTDLTPARAGALETITRTVTRRKTVRVIAAKQASSQSQKTFTVTEHSPARTVGNTIMDVGTVTTTRTVTEIQPVTVTVVETVTEKGKPPPPPKPP